MQQPVETLPVGEFFRRIADPDIFSGGGSVAAVAAAGAGSTALLVMRLNLRRRANLDRRGEIEQAIAATTTTIAAFHAAADDDIAILDALLAAQRALKSGGSRCEYLVALTRAAESPLGIAEQIAELLDLVATQLEISSRFTVSDLGAAAVLAEGACRAALLTAEVNIALLAETQGADQAAAGALDRKRAEMRTRVVERAVMIEGVSRAMIQANNTSRLGQ